MYIGHDFDPADPEEDEVYAFDFVKDLPRGEAIASAVWTCEVAAGSPGQDPGAAGRLQGAPSNNGQVTAHRVVGLVAGVRYVLQAVVTGVNGSKPSLWSYVTCNEPE